MLLEEIRVLARMYARYSRTDVKVGDHGIVAEVPAGPSEEQFDELRKRLGGKAPTPNQKAAFEEAFSNALDGIGEDSTLTLDRLIADTGCRGPTIDKTLAKNYRLALEYLVVVTKYLDCIHLIARDRVGDQGSRIVLAKDIDVINSLFDNHKWSRESTVIDVAERIVNEDRLDGCR